MSNPDLTVLALIIFAAIFLVGIDIYVRLVIVPSRRDRFICTLLDQLMEPSAEPQMSTVSETANSPTPDLKECLLRHFEKSSTSREIINALSGEERLNQRDLLLRLNKALNERGKPPLPLEVARRVATILLHAGLVGVDRDTLRITEAGRELNLLLRGRHEARLQNAA